MDFPAIRILQTTSDATNTSALDTDPLATPYDYLIFVSSIAISFFSFLGALFIILTYIKFTKLRSYTYKLVTFISLSDFVFYLGKLLTLVQLAGFSNPFMCDIQGLLINYGELASVLWSGVIAFTLYHTVIKIKPNFQTAYDLKFKLFAFGVPIIFTIVPYLSGYIGRDGDYCWVIIDSRHRWTSFTVRVIEFYLPLWAVIGYNTYVYFSLMHYLNSINATVDLKRFALFPLILVMCWFFPTLHKLQSIFRDDTKLLTALHNISESMQGILNAVIYGMNENVRYEWKKYLILNNWCLCLFPDAQSFKDNIGFLEFEHQGGSFFGSDSEYSSQEALEAKRNAQNKDIEMKTSAKRGEKK